MVENIARKGETACYKQFLLFSQCFLQLYIFSGIVWYWVRESSVIKEEIARTKQFLLSKHCFKS